MQFEVPFNILNIELSVWYSNLNFHSHALIQTSTYMHLHAFGFCLFLKVHLHALGFSLNDPNF